MSFSLTDKKKINLIRKTVQAISFAQDDFNLQLHQNKIRFMSNYEDNNFVADISNSFFHKFKALEDLKDMRETFIQLRINRDEFLKWFNIQDDREVEFIILFNNNDSGRIQILKTRDTFTVETQLLFEVIKLTEKEKEIYELEYSFSPEMFLVNSSFRQFKNIKNIFKTKMKAESIKMNFQRDELLLTGEFNSKLSLQLQTKDFDNYLNYANLDGEIVKGDNFEIKVPLRFLGLALKISEMMESQFQIAMELVGRDSCHLYIISEDLKGNYSFYIEARFTSFCQVTPSTFENEYPQRTKSSNDEASNSRSSKSSKSKKEVPNMYNGLEDDEDEEEENKRKIQNRCKEEDKDVDMDDNQKSEENEEQEESEKDESDEDSKHKNTLKKESSDEEMTRDEQKEIKKSVKKEQDAKKSKKKKKDGEFYNELDNEEFF